MASSGGKRFFWFILICLSIGGYLLWGKYNQIISHDSSKKTVSQPAPPPFFSTEAVCYLLNADENNRARVMYERQYGESEIKGDNSLVYSFDLSSEKGYGYIKFFRHSSHYYFAFSNPKAYEDFTSTFKNNKKIGKHYVLNNQCFASDMNFIRKLHRYVVIITKDTTLSRETAL